MNPRRKEIEDRGLGMPGVYIASRSRSSGYYQPGSGLARRLRRQRAKAWYENHLLWYWVIIGIVLIAVSIIIYSQPSLLPELSFPLLGAITLFWWVLPPTFVYLIPAYLRKKELERREKKRDELEKLVRSFERRNGVIPLDVEVSGTKREVKAELIYRNLHSLDSGKYVKHALWKGTDQQTYVTISLSYYGKRNEVSVRDCQELKERTEYFVSTVLENRKNERERNVAADELYRQLTEGESVPRRKRKRSSSPKLGKKLPDDVAKEFGMTYEPMEEQGVVSIFGRVHEKLGFEEIWSVQQGYPDGSGKMNGKLVDIEYEFRSSGFGEHIKKKQWTPNSHLTIIVCWRANKTIPQLVSAEYPDLANDLPDNLQIISLKDFADNLHHKNK